MGVCIKCTLGLQSCFCVRAQSCSNLVVFLKWRAMLELGFADRLCGRLGWANGRRKNTKPLVRVGICSLTFAPTALKVLRGIGNVKGAAVPLELAGLLLWCQELACGNERYYRHANLQSYYSWWCFLDLCFSYLRQLLSPFHKLELLKFFLAGGDGHLAWQQRRGAKAEEGHTCLTGRLAVLPIWEMDGQSLR